MAQSQSKGRRKRADAKGMESTSSWPPLLCPRCGGPIVEGQNSGPLFSARLITWEEHPVLSKPPMICGFVSADGHGSRHDLTLHEQLIQRASIGGPRERAALAHFEEMFVETLVSAVVSELEKEAAEHGVDVRAWFANQPTKNDSAKNGDPEWLPACSFAFVDEDELPCRIGASSLAKGSFDRDIRDWARIGAERRLVEIAEEAAAIHRAFPELRDRHETSGTRATTNTAAPPKARRRRRRMSAAGRERLRAALKKRWAAAKKAGKTKLS